MNVMDNSTEIYSFVNNTSTNNGSEIAIVNSNTNDTNASYGSYLYSSFKNFFEKFDRYTLIMSSAFLVGLLLIACLIGIAFCICKSLSRVKRKKIPPSQLTTNPAYQLTNPDNADSFNNLNLTKDNTPMSISHKSPSSTKFNKNEHELKSLLNTSNSPQDYQKDDIKSSKQSLDSTLTSSNLSINSIVKSPFKTLSDIKSKTTINNNGIRNSISNLTQQLKNDDNQEAIKLIDDTENDHDIKDVEKNPERIRFTPSFTSKTSQQIQKEISTSRRSLFSKNKPDLAQSQSDVNTQGVTATSRMSSKRVSISSSNSSILQHLTPVNFELVDSEIDYLEKMVKMKNLDSSTNVSESNLNQSRGNLNNQSQSNSVNNSISNIYIKAINEKREANKQKAGGNNAANAGFNQAKRHSINNATSINTNPNGGANTSSNRNVDTESIKTYESEKSCY